jgi:putative hydrolase of the HAD superfamily
MVHAVLFDLDGTLFDRDATVGSVGAAQFDAFESQLGGIAKHDFVARLKELDDHGFVDKTRVYAILVAELRLPQALSTTLTSDFWDRYHRFCLPFADTLATLTALRSRGKKLALVTNGQRRVQEGTVDALGIGDLFDALLISEVEGVRKPDREMFWRAAARLGVEPAACCHVGDHPTVDVQGALNAGLGAIWKRTAYWPPPASPVPSIERLSEVLPLI